MRLAVHFTLFIMLAMLIQPACQASAPLVPILTLTIDPPSQDVNSSTYAPVDVSFNGTASVQKAPIGNCLVNLTASVDIGWAAKVSPTQLIMTPSSTRQFTAYVTVPIAAPNMTGILTVTGHALGTFEDSYANVTAIINVIGVQIQNRTTSNQTAKHAASGTGAFASIGGSTIVTVSITAVVIAAVAVGGVVIYKKRKGKGNAPEA